jgi:hypothetical protein
MCVFQDVAISSCFRSAGIQTVLALIPFLEICIDAISEHRVLVLDTNVILSYLSAFASIINNLQWTVVIPVPIIMELDGLSSHPSKLGEAAQNAMAYITLSHSLTFHVTQHPDLGKQLPDVTQRMHRAG